MNRRFSFLRAYGLAAALLFSTTAASGAEAFLKVAGIDGESTNDRHVGWSDVLSFNIGVQNDGWELPGGGGTGKASFSPMHIQKHVDSASPKLFGAVLTGMHFQTATIEVVTSGMESRPFVRWEFEDVIISSYSTGWSADVPLEAVSLDYRRIKYTYLPQRPDGSLGDPIVFGWDRATNTTWLTGSGSLADFEFVTNFASVSVPEPGALALLSCGLTFLALSRRANRRAARRASELPEMRASQ